ncbi:MAG: YtxH domain-containing protein [Prolixibacteraceae bacterium]|nr:YtxH domain-containing protein [Prolixibacteraceae bacterium]
MKTSYNTGNLIASLFIGALTGAVIGILFTPKTKIKIVGGKDKVIEKSQKNSRSSH